MLKSGLSFVAAVSFAVVGSVACSANVTPENTDEDSSELQADIDTPWVECQRPKDARGCAVFYTTDLDGLAWTWGLGKGYVPKGTVLTAAARAQGSYLILGMPKNGGTEYNVESPAGAVRVVDTTATDQASAPDASKEWRRGRNAPFTSTNRNSKAFVGPALPRTPAVDNALDRLFCTNPAGCDVGYTHWLGRSVPLPKKATCGSALPVIVRASTQRQYVVSTPMINGIAEDDARFGRVKVLSMDDGNWGTEPGACPGTEPPVSGDFVCGSQGTFDMASENAPLSQLVDVRVGKHPSFDRFVMEFSNGVPGYIVGRQDSATFNGGNGDVQVAGNAGLNVIVSPASGWKDGQPTYTGPNRFRGGPMLKEAALVADYEGAIVWGLGLQSAGCFRITKLANPPRLVVDVKH
jgi:hypothetical protein